jgi:hypothetical protein
MTSWLVLTLVLSTDPIGSAAGLAPCVGDCSGDGTVAINEAIIGVNIALGNAPLSMCQSFDRNGDGMVGINELIASIGSILNGCEPPAGGLRLEPVGGEFRISVNGEGTRGQSQAAVDADGDFAVIWGDTVTSEDSFGIAGRRFRSDGTPTEPLEFAVNTFTTSAQRTQDVAIQPGGAFLAVWETSGQPLEDDDVRAGIYGRRFDTGGVALGTDFKINTNDVDYVREDQPAATTLADDSYIVAWTNRENFVGGRVYVTARRVDATGLPTGEEFAITDYTAGLQDRPAIATLSDGGFVVVWQDGLRDGFAGGIFGQRFDSTAGRVGTEFQVNNYTFSQQRHPAVAASPDGGFLVTWGGIVGSDEQIIARRYDDAGQPLGTEFEVNTPGSLGQQAYPSLAAEPDGGYLVVWMSGGSIGRFNVFGQRIDRNGAKVDGEFQINTFTTINGNRAFPEVATNAAGDVVVVWESNAQDSTEDTDFSIYGQRYRLVE